MDGVPGWTVRRVQQPAGHVVGGVGAAVEMRAVTTIPLDLYVEAPDGLGGVVRGNEVADLIAASSPLYVKFGLRNSRGIYPSGLHLESDAISIGREKVRRAKTSLEWLKRDGRDFKQSLPGAMGIGVPQP